MKTARIIVTRDCPRKCTGCCNNQPQFRHIPKFGKLEHVREYDQIILTGGEPMLNVKLLISLIAKIRELNPTVEIIVYTALYKDNLADLLTITYLVDGLTLTIHEKSDLHDFLLFDMLLDYSGMPKRKLRLNVFKDATQWNINVPRWKVKSNIEWIEDCPLPENETIFEL